MFCMPCRSWSAPSTSLAAVISSVAEPDYAVSMSADHTAEGCPFTL